MTIQDRLARYNERVEAARKAKRQAEADALAELLPDGPVPVFVNDKPALLTSINHSTEVYYRALKKDGTPSADAKRLYFYHTVTDRNA